MSPDRLDLDRLEKLLELLGRHGVAQFEYEDADMKVHLDLVRATTVAVAAPAPVLAAAPPPGAAVPAPTTDARVHKICSPIVGTFYIAPSPDANPFVKVGDRVRSGQILCIIEAMKLMNELESDCDGVVTSIQVEDKQPVQFGQVLFEIRVD